MTQNLSHATPNAAWRPDDFPPPQPLPLPDLPDSTSAAWQLATGLDWPMVDDGAPKTRQDLIDTYGTADPAKLRFAFAEDVALAKDLAAEQPAVAA